MFLRCKTIKRDGKQYQYYQVVINKRLGRKVRQKVITTLGTQEQAKAIAKVLAASDLTSLPDNLTLVDLNKDITPVWSKEYGLPFIYYRLFTDCGLATIVDNIAAQHPKLGFTLTQTVFNLILNRLMQPAAEHKIAKYWNKTIYQPWVAGLALHHLYRTVNLLSEHKEKIEQDLFCQTRDLFNQQIDLAFFDTTSTYLAGSQSEQLGQFGYSKDRRSGRRQIVIGVLLGPNHIPIGCEVFPGNMADVDAMVKIVYSVKQRFSINKIILVGDGGVNSQDNRDLLAEQGLEYILGTRMRNIKIVKEYIANNQPLIFDGIIVGRKKGQTGQDRRNKAKENNDLQHKEVWLNNQRYIIAYNPREAKRQAETRKNIIAQLSKQMKRGGIKSLIKNKGQRKYLKINDQKDREIITIDQDKAREEEKFDGLFVCETNTKLGAEEIVRQYKSLWQVERAFRNLKDVIEMRPIYHQNDQMIVGHIFISFLALYLEMYLRKKLADQGIDDTDYVNELLTEVRAIKAVKIKVKDKEAVMRTELPDNVHELFQALSIRPPDRILQKRKGGE